MKPPTSRVFLSVIAPLFQTAEFLPELARRVGDTCRSRGWQHQLLLVDDHSPGADLEVACRLAAEDLQIGVLGLKENLGQNLCEIIGMAHASGEWIVLIDADLQDPPEFIPELFRVAQEGADAVFGARRGRYEIWHRRLTSRIFKGLQAKICRVPSNAGLFVLLSRRLSSLIVSKATLESRLIPMIGMSGMRMKSIPVMRDPRTKGTSAYSSLRRLETGLGTLGFAWRHRMGVSPAKALCPEEYVVFRIGNLN